MKVKGHHLHTLSTLPRAFSPGTFISSVISSRDFWTSLICLLLIGKAYRKRAFASLIGGPEIRTLNSDMTGPLSNASTLAADDQGRIKAAATAMHKALFWRDFAKTSVITSSSCKIGSWCWGFRFLHDCNWWIKKPKTKSSDMINYEVWSHSFAYEVTDSVIFIGSHTERH